MRNILRPGTAFVWTTTYKKGSYLRQLLNGSLAIMKSMRCSQNQYIGNILHTRLARFTIQRNLGCQQCLCVHRCTSCQAQQPGGFAVNGNVVSRELLGRMGIVCRLWTRKFCFGQNGASCCQCQETRNTILVRFQINQRRLAGRNSDDIQWESRIEERTKKRTRMA